MSDPTFLRAASSEMVRRIDRGAALHPIRTRQRISRAGLARLRGAVAPALQKRFRPAAASVTQP